MNVRRKLLVAEATFFTVMSVSLAIHAAWIDEPYMDEPGPGTVEAGEIVDLIPGPAVETPKEDAFEIFEATAYCDFGITYSGVLVHRGIVAADPRVLPIGSVIEIEAGRYSGIYTVMDTGGVVKGRIIDIYMPEYEEAIQFGRQQVELRVIRRGWDPGASESFGYTVAG
jgi:3D (Asp-Asp-Asp) domain-containing protein